MRVDLEDAVLLVVDDQQANVDVLTAFLEVQGYENVLSTTDPRQAVELIQAHTPDLLLLDLMMPHISGYELMERVKGLLPEGHFMPILVLTADATQEARKKSLSNGASDFLTKPFDLVEAGLRIRNLLFTAYLMQQLRDQNAVLEDKVRKRTEQLQAANYQLVEERNRAVQNEFKYRTLFNANRDSITVFYVDPERGPGKFIDANEAGNLLAGYTREELFSLSPQVIEAFPTPEVTRDRAIRLMQDGMVQFETVLRKKDGSLLEVDIRAILIEFDGKPAVLNITRDISQQKAQIKAIKEQNKTLREIAWTQSHVVRAPLARIMAVMDVLAEPESPDFTHAEAMEVLRSSTLEIDNIIHDISRRTWDAKLDGDIDAF